MEATIHHRMETGAFERNPTFTLLPPRGHRLLLGDKVTWHQWSQTQVGHISKILIYQSLRWNGVTQIICFHLLKGKEDSFFKKDAIYVFKYSFIYSCPFWPCHVACGILVPWPWTETASRSWSVQSSVCGRPGNSQGYLLVKQTMKTREAVLPERQNKGLGENSPR